MAIIKSNAYGHGLVDFAKITENKVDWFGVDSITEGLKLRQKGLKKPILVLGYTLPSRIEETVQNSIS
jgi:alanine racemase